MSTAEQRKEYNRRYNQKPETKKMKAERERRRRAEGLVPSRAKEVDAVVTPIATKRRKRGIVEIRDELNYYQHEAVYNGWSDRIPCYRNDKPFTGSEIPKTQAEAQELCAKTGAKCPVLALCNELAWATKPRETQVLGGVLWVHGRPGAPSEEPLNLIRAERERAEAEAKNAA